MKMGFFTVRAIFDANRKNAEKGQKGTFEGFVLLLR